MKKRLLALTLVIVLIFSSFAGCTNKSHTHENQTAGLINSSDKKTYSEEEKKKAQEDFDKLLNEIFVSQVTSSTLTLRQRIRDISKYGITETSYCLSDFSPSFYSESSYRSESFLQLLETYNYDMLSDEQQIMYDILKDGYDSVPKLKNSYMYTEVLSPGEGIHSQIPVAFDEFDINCENDIIVFLALSGQISEFYKKVVDFEKKKGEYSCFMSENAFNKFVDTCTTLSDYKNLSYIVEDIGKKIDAIPSLTTEQKNSYNSQIENSIKNNLPKAYKELINGVTAVKNQYGCNNKGLSSLPYGKEYYELLVKDYVGTDKSVDELKKQISASLLSTISDIGKLSAKNPTLVQNYANIVMPYVGDPDGAIRSLISKMKEDFPEPPTIEYKVKNINKALESSTAPAFYMLPHIDDIHDNVIYLNGSDKYKNSSIFSNLAHEGFPGHLYQTTYYLSKNPHPLRSIMSFYGYQEGWALYTELYSYKYAGLSEDEANIIVLDNKMGFALYCLADIGINYEGWDREQTKVFLQTYGVQDEQSVDDIYNTLKDDPAVYLRYFGGYLQIVEMLNHAKNRLGENFNLKEFHEFFLDFGPAPFYIMDDYFEEWLAAKSLKVA